MDRLDFANAPDAAEVADFESKEVLKRPKAAQNFPRKIKDIAAAWPVPEDDREQFGIRESLRAFQKQAFLWSFGVW